MKSTHYQSKSNHQILFNPQISIYDLQNHQFQKNIIEFECQFNTVNFQSQLNELQPKFQNNIILQIQRHHLIQRHPNSHQILSLLPFDYRHRFQIVRPVSNNFESNTLPSTLILYIDETPLKTIKLQPTPVFSEKFQLFIQILASKYIVQTGFLNCFKPLRRIAKGSEAAVYMALDLRLKKEVAIKAFKRNREYQKRNIKRQMKILSELRHPNICHLKTLYESENSSYMIFQLFPCSLLVYLHKSTQLPSKVIKHVMYSLLSALNYIHSKGIVHRDIKLQNIMIKGSSNSQKMIDPVIIDFGLAQQVGRNHLIFKKAGTAGYFAPEIFNNGQNIPIPEYEQDFKRINSSCDIFSLGVVFYIILTKKHLFNGKSEEEVLNENKQFMTDQKIEALDIIHTDCKTLLFSMLEKDAEKRITAKEALGHLYFRDLAEMGSDNQKEKEKRGTSQLLN